MKIVEEKTKLYNDLTHEINSIYCQIINNNIVSTGLMDGQAGVLLFLSYYNLIYKNNIVDDICKLYINNIIQSLNYEESKHWDSKPYQAGKLWVLFKVYELNRLPNLSAVELTFNWEELMNHVLDEIENGNYDLVSGSLSVAVLILDYCKLDSVEQFWYEVVKKLYKKAHKSGEFVSWKDEYPENHNPETKGNSIYNLGVAHGIPAIILLLLKIQNSFPNKLLEQLVIESLIWLKTQAIPESSRISSVYPQLSGDVETNYSRLGWCYGDNIIALVYITAGNKFKNSGWINYGVELAIKTTNRLDNQKTMIYDTCFCHGSAGVAHIYSVLFKMTKIDVLKEAALYWYSQTVLIGQYNSDSNGKGNHLMTYLDDGALNYYFEDNLLEGRSGVGLVLLSACYQFDDIWESIFMLDV